MGMEGHLKSKPTNSEVLDIRTLGERGGRNGTCYVCAHKQHLPPAKLSTCLKVVCDVAISDVVSLALQSGAAVQQRIEEEEEVKVEGKGVWNGGGGGSCKGGLGCRCSDHSLD